ncbi:MAG: NAD(P)H-hydrate dehydratase [Candidatus Altiarchaeota archaeon]|nr:NAD(P)H-hydrate dehydratase [Candidatus Altiarchaeota archaeon]
MDPTELSKAVDMNSSYLGVDRLMLMENAGREVAIHGREFNSIAVFAGLGNNGGDGLVAARHLSGLGKRVKIYTLSGNRSRECQKNFDIVKRIDSIEVEVVRDSQDCGKISLSGFDLVVDSLLGVGVRGELREPIKSLVDIINKTKAHKIAVDCPTPGVKADLTLSFHVAKTPNSKVVDIGIPQEAEYCCGPGDVFLALPERHGSEHKGDFGRLLVVGGSKDFVGTPTLVGEAALRTGADLAVICCPSYVAARMPFNPDLIIHPLDSELYLQKHDVDRILGLDFDCLVVGNGLGTEEETYYALKKLLKGVDKPIVLDADALKLMKTKHLKENFILTPHAREFELLFGVYPEDRKAVVEECAKKTGCVILLKGAVDVISDGRETKLNRTGNAGMTVGGTGDVLAGIVGALACKAESFRAACAGAFLSGLSGDLAYRKLDYSFTATDCIERIPYAIKFCRRFM